MIMVRVVASPGQTRRNGHPRARCEDWERDPLAPAATTGAIGAIGATAATAATAATVPAEAIGAAADSDRPDATAGTRASGANYSAGRGFTVSW
jgi:hypothetical protein